LENQFSQRIEFRIAKYGYEYRSLANISGSYDKIIKRYTPLLAIIYHKHFYNNVLVNPVCHPYFSNIYNLAKNDRLRYRGTLEKFKTHVPEMGEDMFYREMDGPSNVSDLIKQLEL
jgi:hypothetical protein